MSKRILLILAVCLCGCDPSASQQPQAEAVIVVAYGLGDGRRFEAYAIEQYHQHSKVTFRDVKTGRQYTATNYVIEWADSSPSAKGVAEGGGEK